MKTKQMLLKDILGKFGNDCYGEYIFNSTLEWPIQQILVGMQFNIRQMLSADIWHIVIKNSEFTQVL